MDFIETLPKSEGKDTILIVVDKLTKYAYFIPLSQPFTTKTIVQLFIDNIFMLHGLPLAIITDRDRIFISQLWQDLFKSLMSSSDLVVPIIPKLMVRQKGLTNAWRITLNACCSNNQRNGILNCPQLSGGTTLPFIHP
jgi:hypothetical protein